MKLILSYTCPEKHLPKELVIETPMHIPRIGETVMCEAIVNNRGVYWPTFKVVDVIWDYISNEIVVKLE